MFLSDWFVSHLQVIVVFSLDGFQFRISPASYCCVLARRVSAPYFTCKLMLCSRSNGFSSVSHLQIIVVFSLDGFQLRMRWCFTSTGYVAAVHAHDAVTSWNVNQHMHYERIEATFFYLIWKYTRKTILCITSDFTYVFSCLCKQYSRYVYPIPCLLCDTDITGISTALWFILK